ncbi:TPA: class I SAM-dependent methyltransferase [Candidatus Micrarchaeota archaeon]|nr:class I SAM-dependent methyltransferase [Candidatus Micrarchaeota archaeon]
MKHPSLPSHARKDDPNLAAQHILIEIQEARRLWKRSTRGNIDSILKTFKLRLCYNTSVLYALCSWFKPRIVVETGVWFGASSSFILAALADNGTGHLYSIDLPNITYQLDDRCKLQIKTHSDVLPKDRKSGFGIPSNLHDRWTLITGDAKRELPKLVEELGKVDLFNHDSLHTYEHMQFEYKTVWPRLSTGGVLVSDDVDWNDAFEDFCNSIGVSPHIYESTGYAVKTT